MSTLASVTIYDVYSNLPSPGIPGRLFFVSTGTNAGNGYYDTGSAWELIVSPGGSSPLTTKGDIYGYSTTNARIPVGTDGYVLTAASGAALGVSRRAVACAGEFKPQDVANLMWALATLGTEPGAELGLAMSRRAVACAGEFKPQEVANLMWTDAVLCVQSGRFFFYDLFSHPLCAIHLVFQVCVFFFSFYAIFCSYEIIQFVFMTRLLRRPFSASFIRRSSVLRWRGCGRACGCRV